MRYECGVCGYVYGEAAEGVAFSELSEGWKCPICGAAKIYFKPMEEVQESEEAQVPKPKRKVMRKASRAELEYASGFERP